MILLIIIVVSKLQENVSVRIGRVSKTIRDNKYNEITNYLMHTYYIKENCLLKDIECRFDYYEEKRLSLVKIQRKYLCLQNLLLPYLKYSLSIAPIMVIPINKFSYVMVALNIFISSFYDLVKYLNGIALTKNELVQYEELTKKTDHTKVNYNFDIFDINEKSIYVDQHLLLRVERFKIKTNEEILLMGDNGVGKSLLCENIAGIRDDNIYDNNTSLLRRGIVSYFISNPYIFDMTLKDNISLGNNIDSINLNRYELLDKQNVRGLSDGEKARVEYCRVILSNKQVIIFDEPFKNLDSKFKILLQDEINKLTNTVILITHDFLPNIAFDRYFLIEEKHLIEIDRDSAVQYYGMCQYS